MPQKPGLIDGWTSGAFLPHILVAWSILQWAVYHVCSLVTSFLSSLLSDFIVSHISLWDDVKTAVHAFQIYFTNLDYQLPSYSWTT